MCRAAAAKRAALSSTTFQHARARPSDGSVSVPNKKLGEPRCQRLSAAATVTDSAGCYGNQFAPQRRVLSNGDVVGVSLT